MKLNVDVNEAVISGATGVGEFRIRNSAKAFKILSDGLYSNKIRAIIRELSCNAVDSHVAAGKSDVPFEVHLPNVFEPYFSVKDTGTGLDDDQVKNIYTTYFESTKTSSNEFIGALGLGSKSPFSYTENFTITARKNGRERVYTAFINDAGIPSVAMMGDQETQEPNGVEVKFSVVNRLDFDAFKNEAIEVFRWFKNKPKINLDASLISDPTYSERDIIPGVHHMGGNYHSPSYAVMGNICYPLTSFPNAVAELGHLEPLLKCGLVMEFGIGELDFSASRESLSYIPLTVNSIRQRLQDLNAKLESYVAEKANEITNAWQRVFFLDKKSRDRLFQVAVKNYANSINLPLWDKSNNNLDWCYLDKKALEAMGVVVSAFGSQHGSIRRIAFEEPVYTNGQLQKDKVNIKIRVSEKTSIILNDTKVGCVDRAKYHFKDQYGYVYCFTVSEKDPVKKQLIFDQLLKMMLMPPTVLNASVLSQKERKKSLSKQGILLLTEKSYNNYSWVPISEEIDSKETYYYLELNNFDSCDDTGAAVDPGFWKKNMETCGISNISNIKIYGVRKSKISEIKKLANWVPLRKKLTEEIAKISNMDIRTAYASDALDRYLRFIYNKKEIMSALSQNSKLRELSLKVGKVNSSGSTAALTRLCEMFGNKINFDTAKKEVDNIVAEIKQQYPLLEQITHLSPVLILHYINLVETQEKKQ